MLDANLALVNTNDIRKRGLSPGVHLVLVRGLTKEGLLLMLSLVFQRRHFTNWFGVDVVA